MPDRLDFDHAKAEDVGLGEFAGHACIGEFDCEPCVVILVPMMGPGQPEELIALLQADQP